jgi:hypothetical protein
VIVTGRDSTARRTTGTVSRVAVVVALVSRAVALVRVVSAVVTGTGARFLKVTRVISSSRVVRTDGFCGAVPPLRFPVVVLAPSDWPASDTTAGAVTVRSPDEIAAPVDVLARANVALSAPLMALVPALVAVRETAPEKSPVVVDEPADVPDNATARTREPVVADVPALVAERPAVIDRAPVVELDPADVPVSTCAVPVGERRSSSRLMAYGASSVNSMTICPAIDVACCVSTITA